jgi:hypothetical protein
MSYKHRYEFVNIGAMQQLNKNYPSLSLEAHKRKRYFFIPPTPRGDLVIRYSLQPPEQKSRQPATAHFMTCFLF